MSHGREEEVRVSCPAGEIIGTTTAGISRFHSIRHLAYEDFGPSRPAPAARIDARRADPGAVALTVTVPADAAPGSDLPVLVYIHGGRYESGSHEEARSRGDAFAHAGIITVTLGYRLGMPGFVRFHDDPPHRYRGVDDCLNGLAWVQHNIEAFGGDPTNVTLAGQSAGAGIALWLSRRDHFRGEFRRVMALSPAFPRRTFEQRKGSLRMALGLPVTRGALSQASPAALVRGYRAFARRHTTDMALGPAPFDPTELAELPILLSETREEFYHHDLGTRIDAAGTSAAALGVRLAGKTMGLTRVRDYLAGARAVDPRGLARQLIGDSTVRRWAARTAEQAPGPLWLREYRGSHDRPALHSGDLPLMFHTLGSDGGTDPTDPVDVALADMVHGDAVAFCRGTEPAWPRYRVMDGERRAQVIDITDPGDGVRVIDDPLALVRRTFS